MNKRAFKKSTYSRGVVMCVEVSIESNSILVRDSKNPQGSILSFTDGEWDAFVKGVKNSEFDL